MACLIGYDCSRHPMKRQAEGAAFHWCREQSYPIKQAISIFDGAFSERTGEILFLEKNALFGLLENHTDEFTWFSSRSLDFRVENNRRAMLEQKKGAVSALLVGMHPQLSKTGGRVWMMEERDRGGGEREEWKHETTTCHVPLVLSDCISMKRAIFIFAIFVNLLQIMMNYNMVICNMLCIDY